MTVVAHYRSGKTKEVTNLLGSSSSNNSIAKVPNDKYIYGIKAGTATMFIGWGDETLGVYKEAQVTVNVVKKTNTPVTTPKPIGTMQDVTNDFVGKIITAQSNYNKKYVSADTNYSNNPAICNRDVANTWEQFEVVSTGGGYVGFKALSNNKYLSAWIQEDSNAPIQARASKLDTWECFKIYKQGNNYFILARVNGNYLSVRADRENKPVMAMVKQALEWEQFSIEPLIKKIEPFDTFLSKIDGNSDTYRIMLDLKTRWLRAETETEKQRLSLLAQEVISMYAEYTPAVYYQERIYDYLVNTGQEIKKINDTIESAPLPLYMGAQVAKLNGFISVVKSYSIFDLKTQDKWKYPYNKYHDEVANKVANPYMYYEGMLWSCEDLGNLNFGFIGAIMGYSEEFLSFGAGMYQILQGHSEWQWMASYWDDPNDNFFIRLGVRMYKNEFIQI